MGFASTADACTRLRARGLACLGRWSTFVSGMILGMIFAGCASPGPPRPPSLNLPAPVTDLQVQRVGDAVELRWTTPSDSTDDLLLKGPLAAEVCVAPTVAEETCQAAAKLPVQPGGSQATLPLGASRSVGLPALLVVRLRVLNAAGRSAGWSAPRFTAAGVAPAAVSELRASAMEGGARLEWRRVSGAAPVLLRRTLLEPTAAAAIQRGSGAPAETELRAADAREADPGGALDHTALKDHLYRYTAQRVETETLAGHSIEVRGPVSAPTTVLVKDVFPPAAPTGAATVPGVATVSGDQAPAAVIELSWEPNAEVDLAGYLVERSEAEPGVQGAALSWRRLTPTLLAVPNFRDGDVVAGHRYFYRILAVDASGNVSAPSAVVEETAAPTD